MSRLNSKNKPTKWRDIKNLKPSERAKISRKDKNSGIKKPNNSDSSSSNTGSMSMGDMFGTGIPGGMDCDFSTPF